MVDPPAHLLNLLGGKGPKAVAFARQQQASQGGDLFGPARARQCDTVAAPARRAIGRRTSPCAGANQAGRVLNLEMLNVELVKCGRAAGAEVRQRSWMITNCGSALYAR